MGQNFWSTAILDFLIALGAVLGGVLLGGLGAFFTDEYPMDRMLKLADQLKIWAMVAAIGGTIDNIKVFQINILGGEINLAIQQIIIFVSAFIGAHIGTVIIHWLILGDL